MTTIEALEFDPALVYVAAPTAAGGAAVAASITARPGPEPTAVFAFNDLVAFGLLGGLAGMDVRVPGDISVVGFDGIDRIAVILAGAHLSESVAAIQAEPPSQFENASRPRAGPYHFRV